MSGRSERPAAGRFGMFIEEGNYNPTAQAADFGIPDLTLG
jgi:hypothetical protein